MMLTPFATRMSQPLANWYRRWRGAQPVQTFDALEHGLHDHIIIAGYGRVGRYTADVLLRLDLPCVVLELDQSTAERARAAGLPVIYGDASSPVVLEAAEVHTARLLLVTVPAAIDVELVVRAARQLRSDLHILARAARRAQIETLRALGVHEVVQPEFEAGLEMVRQTLLHFDRPATEIQRLSDTVRDELYQPFQTLHTDANVLEQLRRAGHALEVEWFTLPDAASLVGQSIGQAGIRRRSGTSIVTVLRGETVYSNPGPALILAAGDMVAVLGTRVQRERFRASLAPVSAAGDGAPQAVPSEPPYA
jgi:K+:H+ antiporter